MPNPCSSCITSLPCYSVGAPPALNAKDAPKVDATSGKKGERHCVSPAQITAIVAIVLAGGAVTCYLMNLNAIATTSFGGGSAVCIVISLALVGCKREEKKPAVSNDTTNVNDQSAALAASASAAPAAEVEVADAPAADAEKDDDGDEGEDTTSNVSGADRKDAKDVKDDAADAATDTKNDAAAPADEPERTGASEQPAEEAGGGGGAAAATDDAASVAEADAAPAESDTTVSDAAKPNEKTSEKTAEEAAAPAEDGPAAATVDDIDGGGDDLSETDEASMGLVRLLDSEFTHENIIAYAKTNKNKLSMTSIIAHANTNKGTTKVVNNCIAALKTLKGEGVVVDAEVIAAANGIPGKQTKKKIKEALGITG